MRRILILFPLLALASCMSKEPSKVDTKTIKRGILDYDKDTLNGYSFESLVEKKFKEFYDLNVLLKNYPNFKQDIEKRIENFTSGTRKIFQINDSVKVSNIRQKGPFVKVSDSTEMTHVLFDIITTKEIKTDSVMAFITTIKLQLDNEEVTSTKVKFKRLVFAQF